MQGDQYEGIFELLQGFGDGFDFVHDAQFGLGFSHGMVTVSGGIVVNNGNF
jgi:hypothetical protein